MLIMSRVFKSIIIKHRTVFTYKISCYTVYSNSFSSNTFVPVYGKAQEFPDRLAVVDQYGKYSYNDIFCQSVALSEKILSLLQKPTNNHRVSFLCENDVSYVIAQWACWLSKNIAVPLCKIHPPLQLEYYVNDSQSSLIVTTNEFTETLKPISQKLSIPILEMKHPKHETASYVPLLHKDSNTLRKEYSKMKYSDAMIVYTSGTTGPPKGVVLTHDNLHCTITTLIDAWEWKHTDTILHTLPLHHIHGIVNALMCPLYCGACCIMFKNFDASQVWENILDISGKPNTSIFMAVPTMYAKLIEEYDNQFLETHYYSRTKEFIKHVCKEKLRLMVSGSAAMPLPVMKRWEEITGHCLLERYGMTEIGMALSNPLHGKRLPGFVGSPLKGVEVRIVKKNKLKPSLYDVIVEGDSIRSNVAKGQENEIGELQVRGRTVFKEYWNKAEATKNSFTSDGWFKTGDTAQYANGAYRILGRTSVDIIKSGGYKISALDVERILLTHPSVKECAVVGIPDMTWGEKIAAIIVTTNEEEITLFHLRDWCEDKMAPYQVPSVVKYLKILPRNVMGKVNKKDLVTNIFS